MQTQIQTIALSRINFLLTLEYTQSQFYQQGIASPAFNAIGSLTGGSNIQTGISLIASDQLNHIAYLRQYFNLAVPIDPATLKFDFTVGNNLPDVFSNPQSLLLLAQILEDTGVRCYKGMLQNFTVSPVLRSNYLQSLLGIHSVEARHAGYIRNVRRTQGQSIAKPWVTLNQLTAAGLPTTSTQGSLVTPVYNFEDNFTQAQINLIGLNGHKEIDQLVASEAFDEVMAEAQVKLILQSVITAGLI